MTKRTWIILAIVVVVIIIVILILRQAKAYRTFGSPLGAGAVGTETAPTGQQTGQDAFPLSQGSKGQNVKNLQIYLNKWKHSIQVDLVADGDFGPKTSAMADWVLQYAQGHIEGTVTYAEFMALEKAYEGTSAANWLTDLQPWGVPEGGLEPLIV